MTERLLKKRELAAMLGTSPGVAVSIMSEHGIAPIDWGAGRSRGYRWPESRVRDDILQMYAADHPLTINQRVPKPSAPSISLPDMLEVKELTICYFASFLRRGGYSLMQ